MEPPQKTVRTIERGDAGTAVWCLQRSLNSTASFVNLVEDGKYGAKTEGCVRAFQDLRGIDADGRCGPQTSTHLVQKLISKVNDGLPGGLLLSIVSYESSALIAAVNWSTPGSVDCGCCQRKVLGPPFVDADVRRAFDSLYQLKLLKARLVELHAIFMERSAVHTHEFAWRLATYAHNRPADAQHFSKVAYKDLSSYWTEPKEWVMAYGRHFPDGAPVRSIWDWACRYALGNKAHNEPGQACKYVSDWTS